MKNRYDNLLKQYNKEIIEVSPANVVLRIVVAKQIAKHLKSNSKALEIGCGEGDSTKYILESNPKIKLDALDVSQEMIDLAKKEIKSKNVNFICEDVYEFLKKNNNEYPCIIQVWTFHNFTKEDRTNLFKQIFDSLPEKGFFVMMDKAYPNDKEKSRDFFDRQFKRYDLLEPEELRKAIREHEIQDYSDTYRIDRESLVEELKNIGFEKIEIVDSIERDIVLIAFKP